MAPSAQPLHVLVLSDRDWTHPQAGGTGAALGAQVTRWLAWGHRVTIVTASYPGAEPLVRDGALTIHRGGRPSTVIPRMGWRVRRGLAADADVVLEVVNGIFWLTPLWLKAPCVTYVQHLARGARPLGFLLEALPLRMLYRRSRFLTTSQPVADALVDHGVPRQNTTVREPGDSGSWDATARATLDLLAEEKERDRRDSSLGRAFAGSDTGRAAGLAAAAMATNVIGLALTILFARLLGEDGYGSLAAMVSAFLILALPGQALQVAFARRAAPTGPALGAAPELRRWTRDLLLAAAATAVAAALLREPLADAIGVAEPWGVAAIPPTACIWYLLSIQRGVLQSLGAYRAVGASLIGEGGARLALGGVLIGAGLGPTGGFLGTMGAVALMAAVLGRLLRTPQHANEGQEDGNAGELVRRTLRGAVIPLVALALLAWLQNVDVIVVRHQAETDAAASSYAATSVAAKMVIWIGVGLGLFLLPEAARRVRGGGNGRPILSRTLGIVAAVGVPMVAFYAVLGRPLIEGVFGPELGLATGALPVLGAAMSLLACVYLCVQFLLALGRRAFLVPLAIAAAIEPLLILAVGSDLTAIASVILALQAALAAGVLVLSLRPGSAVGTSPRVPASETTPETAL